MSTSSTLPFGAGTSAVISQKPKLARLNLIATFGFFVLCVFTMLNLNYYTRLFLGTEQVLSIFYLVSCLTVIFALRFPIRESIGATGGFWLFAVLFYLGVSTRMGLGVDPAFFTSPSSNFYRILTAQLIMISAAAGARHMMLAGKLQLLLRIVFGLMLMAAGTIILAKIFPFLADRSGQGRVGGVFSDANRAGHAMCIAAAFGFATLRRETSLFMRMIILGGLLMLLPCLLITNSRSSIIFFVLLIGLQVMFTPILKQKGTVFALVLVAASLPIGIFWYLGQEGSHVNVREAANLEQRQERLESFVRILRGEMSEEDTGHRFTLAALGIKYFASSPVIGVGFHELVRMRETNLGCHNTYIRVFGEGGIFSGILYIAAIGVIAFASWRCRDSQIRILGIGFIAMYSCSAMVAHTAFTMRIGNVCMGIVLGLLTGVITIQQAESRKRRAAIWANAPGRGAVPASVAPAKRLAN